jgi:hypothetical protein
MSVTLDYISADPVPGPVAAQVVAATKPLLQSYDWWAEALFLTHRMHDKRLEGSTRIHLGGYGDVEIPEDEEAVSYNISWKLSELGTEVGRITKGVQSSKLSSYLSSLCSHLKLPLTKAPEVLQRHEARKE